LPPSWTRSPTPTQAKDGGNPRQRTRIDRPAQFLRRWHRDRQQHSKLDAKLDDPGLAQHPSILASGVLRPVADDARRGHRVRARLAARMGGDNRILPAQRRGTSTPASPRFPAPCQSLHSAMVSMMATKYCVTVCLGAGARARDGYRRNPTTTRGMGTLVALGAHTHPAGMMVVTERLRAMRRAIGRCRRLFPAITDTAPGPHLCQDHRRLEATARKAPAVRRLPPRAAQT
jgi:hypothetical protein